VPIAVCAAALALVAFPTTARADVRFPNQRAVHVRELDAMLEVARDFWEARGVTSPCGTTALDVADDRSGPDAPYGGALGRGYSPLLGHQDCRIVLEGHWAGWSLAVIRGRRRPVRDRRWAAAAVCAVLVHEEGHARGLLHSPTGVMAPGAEAVPWDCRVLARLLVLPFRPATARAGFEATVAEGGKP
jgi:hypothetical protein